MKSCVLFFLLFLNTFYLFGKTPTVAFIPNVGQVTDQNGNAVPEVLYSFYANQGTLFITTKGISYVFTEQMDNKKSIKDSSNLVKWCRIDLILRNGIINNSDIIKEEERSNGHLNFFTHNIPEGRENIYPLKKIRFKNVYLGIDWQFLIDKTGNVKYEFIIAPGSSPDLINIEAVGAIEKIFILNEELHIHTPFGKIKDGKPISYLIDNSEVKTRYIINDKVISFELEKYDSNKELIIDPPLVWSTYYGGNNNDECIGIEEDFNGNIYVIGSTTSTVFPSLNKSGAFFQGSFNGSFSDITITKFNSIGNQIWSTYYGGDHIDRPTDINCDLFGNIYLTGWTYSANFPLQNKTGAYFINSIAGSSDGFIIRFDTTGSRRWATYYGGTSEEIFEGILSDPEGNIYLTGYTQSSNLPVLSAGPGKYFQSYSGNRDVFFLKFDSVGSREFCTFFGGTLGEILDGSSLEEAAFAMDSYGNIYLAGQTGSINFPLMNRAGAFNNSSFIPNTTTAFIAMFSTGCDLLWSTLYQSTGRFTAMTIDNFNNLWLTGWNTYGSFPISGPPGSYQQSQASNTSMDFMIVKFTSSGVLEYSSCYGGVGSDQPADITSDGSGSVYLCGNTVGPFPVVDPGGGVYYDPIIDDVDIAILKFGNSGNRIWSTFFGGPGVNISQNSLYTSQGCLYIIGTSYSSGFPTMTASGSYFQSNLNGTADGTISKFCTSCVAPLITNPINLNLCTGSYGEFKILSTGIKNKFIWQVDSGSGFKSLQNSLIYAGTNSSWLKINAVHYSMNGFKFRCIVSNLCGKDTSDFSILAVEGGQIINTEPPSNLNICSNNDTSLICIGSGANISYQWELDSGSGFKNLINTLNFSGTDTSKLNLNNLPLSFNSFKFRCIVKACNNYDTSGITTLSVLSFPVITDHPDTSSFCEGVDTVLKIISNSNIFKWERDTGSGFHSLNNISGFLNPDSSILRIPYVYPQMDNNVFRCITQNMCGSDTSKSALITVIKRNTMELKPDTLKICEVIDTSYVINNSGFTNFQWEIDSGFGFQILNNNQFFTGTNSNKLSISSIPFSLNLSKFKSVRTNLCFTDTSNISVLLITPNPIISTHPEDQKVCIGSSSFLSVNNNSQFSYKWQINQSGTFSDVFTSNNFSNVDSSTLIINSISSTLNKSRFRSVITNHCGADTSAIAVLTLYNDSIIQEPQNTTICEGTDSSFKIIANGVMKSYQWQVNSGNGFLNASSPFTGVKTSEIFLNNIDKSLDQLKFRCYVVDSCNNVDTSSVAILSVITFNLDAGQDSSICAGDTIKLNSTGAVTYSWFPTTELSDSLSADSYAFPKITTKYILTGNNNGCVKSDSLTIKVNQINLSAGNDTLICSNQIIQLNAIGANTYIWDPSSELDNLLIHNPKASPQKSSYFIVTGIIDQCKKKDSVFVHVIQGKVNAGSDTSVCEGENIQLIANGSEYYEWAPFKNLNDPFSSKPIFLGKQKTTIILKGRTADCISFDTITIVVIACDSIDSNPVNVFTPNNDGINDEFFFLGFSSDNFQAFIYNRWGESVYESSDAKSAWNGKNRNGKNLESGVYYFLIFYQKSGKSFSKNGYINLIRE